MTQWTRATVLRAWRPASPSTIQGEVHPWSCELKLKDGSRELAMSIEEPIAGLSVLLDRQDGVIRRPAS